MSDPFEEAIAKAEAEAAEQKRLAERRKAEELARVEARVGQLRDRFIILKTTVLAKEAALSARHFFVSESIDEKRLDFGLVLKGGRKRIALDVEQGGGYRMSIYWDGARTEDGWIQTIATHKPETEDELMSVLGDWLVRYGRTEPQ